MSSSTADNLTRSRLLTSQQVAHGYASGCKYSEEKPLRFRDVREIPEHMMHHAYAETLETLADGPSTKSEVRKGISRT